MEWLLGMNLGFYVATNWSVLITQQMALKDASPKCVFVSCMFLFYASGPCPPTANQSKKPKQCFCFFGLRRNPRCSNSLFKVNVESVFLLFGGLFYPPNKYWQEEAWNFLHGLEDEVPCTVETLQLYEPRKESRINIVGCESFCHLLSTLAVRIWETNDRIDTVVFGWHGFVALTLYIILLSKRQSKGHEGREFGIDILYIFILSIAPLMFSQYIYIHCVYWLADWLTILFSA